MTKLEEVIKGLECCSQIACEACGECPYANECEEGGRLLAGWARLAADALSFLKKQKPTLLKNQHKPYGNNMNPNLPWVSRCPKCGKKIEGKLSKFCKYCGQAVKWDE